MNIDLGRKIDYPEPSYAVPASAPKEPRVIYPSLYIQGGDELKDIPSEGVIKLRYKSVRSSCTTRDGEDKYELELEAHEILGVAGDDAPKKSREQELDDLAKSVADDDDDEEGEDGEDNC